MDGTGGSADTVRPGYINCDGTVPIGIYGGYGRGNGDEWLRYERPAYAECNEVHAWYTEPDRCDQYAAMRIGRRPPIQLYAGEHAYECDECVVDGTSGWDDREWAGYKQHSGELS